MQRGRGGVKGGVGSIAPCSTTRRPSAVTAREISKKKMHVFIFKVLLKDSFHVGCEAAARPCAARRAFQPSAASHRCPAVRQALHIQSQQNEPVEPHLKGQFTQMSVSCILSPTTVNHLDSFNLVNRFLIIGNHVCSTCQTPLEFKAQRSENNKTS